MLHLSPDIYLHSSEDLPEDDVDRLFKKLHRLEPPGDIVKQLLERIKHLPRAQRYERFPSRSDANEQGVPEETEDYSNTAQ
jgi:hypothetical protein